MASAESYNHSRYDPGNAGGFYESYFVRANHPLRPLGFWIRYTVFSPRGRPNDAIGELWAVWFDGEQGRHTVVKVEVPARLANFSRDSLDVSIVGPEIHSDDTTRRNSRSRVTQQIASAWMRQRALRGLATRKTDKIEWNLSWRDGQAPAFLLDPSMYDRAWPKAKSLTGTPNARFDGVITVNGQRQSIEDWTGCHSHNWGTRQTDHYAWGQVCGFDNAPDSFLEVATARVKLGPFWSPYFTTLVLRHEGREIALNTLSQALFHARGRFDFFEWAFQSRTPELEVNGLIRAPRESFVGLRYRNPPGGIKQCLNSKLASCRVTLNRAGAAPLILESRQRAAFEMLTDDPKHGVELKA